MAFDPIFDPSGALSPAATGGSGFGYGFGGYGAASLNAGGLTQQSNQQALLPLAVSMGLTPGFQGMAPTGTSYQQQSIDQQNRAFEQSQLNRDQILKLIGMTPETLGSGGLLGSTFFGSVLNNTLPNVVGGITGNLPGLGQPGFADSPGGGSASFGGGGGNSLFNQQIAGRGQLGRDILSDISQFGGSRRAEIDRDYSNLGNSALARLDARGLGSSNLGTSVMRGVERDRQGARGALEDQLLGQQINAKQQIGDGLFGDVGSELDRGVERQRTGASLLNALLGSAFNTVSL